ncbi:hypothetical protein PIB30_089834, partial [Stylosanthes scabra]|nr:hypothetical protein [Stylosanthes scabra]
KGSLQSKKQSLEAKQRKSSTHMRAAQRPIHARQLWPRLGVAPLVPLTTHRRGGPRICVES